MKRFLIWFVAGLAIAGGAGVVLTGCAPTKPPHHRHHDDDDDRPGPDDDDDDRMPRPNPRPCPGPGPCPRPCPGPCPRGTIHFAFAEAGGIHRGGPADGRDEVIVHLPGSQHVKNDRGKDGSGLCVFTSIGMAADYQNVRSCVKFRDYMKSFDGGGYPGKVDEFIKKLASAERSPTPAYIQVTNGDVAILEMALKTGRYPCVTYSGDDGVFYQSKVSHMVCLVYLDRNKAAIQDNNYPGEYLWMSRKDFLSRWGGSAGAGWMFLFLAPPPPPIPYNDSTPDRSAGVRRSGVTLVSNPLDGVLRELGGAKSDLKTARDLNARDQGRYDRLKDSVAQLPFQPSPYFPQPFMPQPWHPAVPDQPVEAREFYWEPGTGNDVALLFLRVRSGSSYPYRGAWYKSRSAFRVWDPRSERWTGWSDPPRPLPAGQDDNHNYGIIEVGLVDAAPYSIDGRPASREELCQAVAGNRKGTLADDSDLVRVSVTSRSASFRNKVLQDLESDEVANLRDRVLVQAYSPEDWAVRGVAIREGVLIQQGLDAKGRGRVACEILPEDYTGPGQLAEAIRKAAKGYDPDKNPRLGGLNVSNAVIVAAAFVGVGGALLVVVVVVGLLVRSARNRKGS